MTMLKSQKIEFVKNLEKDIKAHKTVAILPMEGLPDRLFQRVKEQLRSNAKVVVARKSLISRALKESGFEKLEPYITGNVALILSNGEPFELYKTISSNKLLLAAKPNQISPEDISIEAGETSIAPGQTVTDLKAGGIDVKIDKGKVVISKDKVLVEKGKKISGAVANALKILDIKPFSVAPKLKVALNGGLIFNEVALGVDEVFVNNEIARNFREAFALSLEMGFVTKYNADMLLGRGYRNAMAVGIEAKVPEPEVTKALIARAAAEAASVSVQVPAEAEASAEQKTE
ncbi:50S ribosomal protein L10 [uncultured archaeon]|nr:50S ribosomal protein L10 [uncultured archaeon]